MIAKSRLAIVGAILMLAGGGLAHLIQTSAGVVVENVRFEFEPGARLAALLYRPPNATPATPAPAVLAVHGYINSRETQSGFAIEFARRGYVVLAIDQTGHGFSEGVAFAAGFGGPAALEYLRALPFVDPANIGLEGHSMGGWTALAAAAAHPDGYQSIALVGSSTGPPFAPPATTAFPRNLGVVFSRYDEFSELMWGVATGADVGSSAKLQAAFGTSQPVEPKRVYGSIATGDARWLAVPRTTHPGDHLSAEAIGDSIEWMDQTLAGGKRVAGQVWIWKELGTLIALLGGVCLLLGGFGLILETTPFRWIRATPVAAVEQIGWRWWTGLAITALVPALTYYPFTGWGAAFAPNALFGQGVTNQILVWAVGNGLIAFAAGLWLARSAPGRIVHPVRQGGALAPMLPAAIAVAGLYAAVALSGALFNTDLRFWVVALKPMAGHHVPHFLVYLIPFTLFFYVSQRAWHATLSPEGSAARQYAAAIVGSAGGLCLMVVLAYAWLFAAGRLPGVDPLFTIVAIQFVPVLTMTAIVSVYAWRRTGSAIAGAVMSGLVVTWYIVAGQATHV